jgi:hypothetical protein
MEKNKEEEFLTAKARKAKKGNGLFLSFVVDLCFFL